MGREGMDVPHNLQLPAALRQAGWRVKIREKERLEPPHVTILNGTQAWRLNLRTCEFMDRTPDPAEISAEVLKTIAANWQALRKQWDQKYPTNPVGSKD